MPSRSTLPALSAIIGSMLGMSVITYLLWLRDKRVVDENDLVEWTQVVFLFGATALHTWKARLKNANADYLVRLVLALLCTSFAVREVDIDRLGSPAVMPAVETVIRLIVIGAWLILSWCVLRVIDVLWNRRVAIAFSAVGILTLAGCVLYAASWAFDKYPESLGGESSAMLIEETIQLNATFLLLVASWCALPRDAATLKTA